MSKRLLVLGGGESGRGVALLAKANGYAVFVSDAAQLSEDAVAELTKHKIGFEQGGHGANILEGVDVIVKSPGIPWGVPLVASAKSKGIRVVGEMEFCAPYRKGKVIGITGSNGKTTTTLLLGHLLKTAGINVAVGGNVGVSYARLLVDQADADWFVLELSSYQLEDIEAFHVEIGMVLNLSPDHLDRYNNSFDAYAAAKYNLRKTQVVGSTWLQAGDKLSLKHVVKLPTSELANVRQVAMPASYESGQAVTPTQGYSLADTSLAGPHNAANASFALTAAELAGVAPEVLAKALLTFENAPHRLERIGFVKGVEYVNDSKATNLDAVDKALRSFSKPIVWIVGGTDKGNDYNMLMPLVKAHVKGVIALGLDNTKIENAFSFYGDRFKNTSSLDKAIEEACTIAEPDDVVLLSPACASFDLFKNYIDRGDQFRAAVKAMPDFRETLQHTL
jgi:UDP-N-acetylmuramoylalanine--D-glutamate ligase